ncbi:hypothetical protein [Nocardia nova]|uniref:hypothetical protein n=1 Tax=Nocardia nova TaxID=37330 RepID=UPI001894523F|nr:hypothetical protein [Nocardia nova]MBF6145554.1 hypothetical protein [Nocardia nova]
MSLSVAVDQRSEQAVLLVRGRGEAEAGDLIVGERDLDEGALDEPYARGDRWFGGGGGVGDREAESGADQHGQPILVGVAIDRQSVRTSTT